MGSLLKSQIVVINVRIPFFPLHFLLYIFCYLGHKASRQIKNEYSDPLRRFLSVWRVSNATDVSIQNIQQSISPSSCVKCPLDRKKNSPDEEIDKLFFSLPFHAFSFMTWGSRLSYSRNDFPFDICYQSHHTRSIAFFFYSFQCEHSVCTITFYVCACDERCLCRFGFSVHRQRNMTGNQWIRHQQRRRRRRRRHKRKTVGDKRSSNGTIFSSDDFFAHFVRFESYSRQTFKSIEILGRRTNGRRQKKI